MSEKAPESDLAPSPDPKPSTEHIEAELPVSAEGIEVGFNRRLTWIMVWSVTAAFTYGFSAAIVSSSLGQPQLYTYFKLAGRSNETGIIGAIASLFSVGGFFSVIGTSYIIAAWGRKAGFLNGAFFACLGAALSAGSRNITMLILGRFFTGVGSWSYMLSCICYTQELSPATQRGALGGSVGVTLMIGYVTAAWISLGFFYYNSENNWRVPLVLQVVPALINLGGLPFVPESPRWLESRGRSQEALDVLKHVHQYPQDPKFLIAGEEHFQIKAQTALEKNLPSSWASMFTKYWKRSLCAVLVPMANQFTGANLLANFGTRLYASLGFSSSVSLIMQAAWYMVGMSFALFTAFVTDRVGRVKLLVYSIVSSAIVLSVEAALAATVENAENAGKIPSKKVQAAAVAMIFIWYLGYAFGEPVQFLYVGEIFPNHLRGKGTAIGLATINVMAVWVTVAQPTAQAAIGWKFYLVFVIPSIVLGIAQYFILPETKNVPLEEVGGLFGDDEEVAIHHRDIHAIAHANDPHQA